MQYQGLSPTPGKGQWTPPWEKRRDKIRCQKASGQARMLVAIMETFHRTPNPCTSYNAKHPRAFTAASVLMPSEPLPETACIQASGTGLKVTPPLQLFSKLGVLSRPGAQPDNQKVQVSQTWPLLSQNCCLLRGEDLVLRGTE